MQPASGAAGVPLVAERCDVAVLVDGLSFTTALSLAADPGVTVWPTQGIGRATAVRRVAEGPHVAGHAVPVLRGGAFAPREAPI